MTIAEVLGGPTDGAFLNLAPGLVSGSRIKPTASSIVPKRDEPVPEAAPTMLVVVWDYSAHAYVLTKRSFWAGWPAARKRETYMRCIICGSAAEVSRPDGAGEQSHYCGAHEPEDA